MILINVIGCLEMIKFFWPQTNILGHKIPNIFEISFQGIVFVPPKEPIKGVLLHVLFLFMKFETSFTVSLNFINYNKKSDGNSPLFPTAAPLKTQIFLEGHWILTLLIRSKHNICIKRPCVCDWEPSGGLLRQLIESIKTNTCEMCYWA